MAILLNILSGIGVFWFALACMSKGDSLTDSKQYVKGTLLMLLSIATLLSEVYHIICYRTDMLVHFVASTVHENYPQELQGEPITIDGKQYVLVPVESEG